MCQGNQEETETKFGRLARESCINHRSHCGYLLSKFSHKTIGASVPTMLRRASLLAEHGKDRHLANPTSAAASSAALDRLLPRVAVEHPVVDRFAQVMGLDIR